jgi:hypothetical protein
MLGTSLVVTLDGSGGTVKTLPLINQDGYTSEYFLDEGLVTYRARVRHSRDNVKVGTQKFDRHTVTFSRFVEPTSTLINGLLSEISFTIRHDPDGVPADIFAVAEAMSFYIVKAGGISAKLLGWES